MIKTDAEKKIAEKEIVMKDIEKSKLNDETLDKVNGGRFKMGTSTDTCTIPYANYVGATVYYNGICTVVDAFVSSSCPGNYEYCYKLQYNDGTTVVVDKATFESIISGSGAVTV